MRSRIFQDVLWLSVPIFVELPARVGFKTISKKQPLTSTAKEQAVALINLHLWSMQKANNNDKKSFIDIFVYREKESLPLVSKESAKKGIFQWQREGAAMVRVQFISAQYEEIMRLHVIPALGHHQLQKLNAQHLQKFYAMKLNDGLSPTTVSHIHNVLHKALKTAKKWKFVAENVCDFVSPPRARHYEVQPLSVEQAQKLLNIVRGRPFEPLLNLALATGMREVNC